MPTSLIEEFQFLSKNELVSFCKRIGIGVASRSLSKGDLLGLLEGSVDAGKFTNPIDELRVEVMDFIEENREFIQLPCHGNCFAHSDPKVVQCHIQLKRRK